MKYSTRQQVWSDRQRKPVNRSRQWIILRLCFTVVNKNLKIIFSEYVNMSFCKNCSIVFSWKCFYIYFLNDKKITTKVTFGNSYNVVKILLVIYRVNKKL